MSFCTPPPSRGTQRRTPHRGRSISSKATRTQFKSPLRQEKLTDEKVVETQENIKKEIEALKEKEKGIDEEIAQLQEQGYKEEELAEHITKLHEYNEIKDVGQMIIGRIAMEHGTTTKEIYQRYELNLED